MYINDIFVNYSFTLNLRLKVIGDTVVDNSSYSRSFCDCNDYANFSGSGYYPSLNPDVYRVDITIDVDDGIATFNGVSPSRWISNFCDGFQFRKIFRIFDKNIFGYCGKSFGFKLYTYGNSVDFDSFYIIGGKPSFEDSNKVDLFNYGRLIYCGKNKTPAPVGLDLARLEFDSNLNSSLVYIVSDHSDVYKVLNFYPSGSGCGNSCDVTTDINVVNVEKSTDDYILDSLNKINDSLINLNKILENMEFNNEIIVDSNSTVNGEKCDYEFNNGFWGR